MKKSKLTIAVLSACMLAATGGISLGAAALANAPQAVSEASEGSLVAGQVISDGIKVIKKASYSNDAISFTYAVTPDYAITNVTATLSWNVSGVSTQIETCLEITSHDTATKTVVVHKKADFSDQAKLILTDSLSNSSATVLIDCMAEVGEYSQDMEEDCEFIYKDFGLCDNINHLDWVNLDEVIEDGVYIGKHTIDPGVYISGVSIHGGIIFKAETPTWSSDRKVQDEVDGLSLSEQGPYDNTYAIEGQGLEDFQVNYGAIRLDLGWIEGWARQEPYRYVHIEITFEVCFKWNTADSTHTSINEQGGSGHLYPTYRWCYDAAELARASAITAEAGHIYF